MSRGDKKQMPSMPKPASSQEGAEVVEQPAMEAAVEKMEEVPVQEDKPEVKQEVKKPSDEVKPAVKKARQVIQVVAIREGFFQQRRRLVGDKFTLTDEKQFSSKWMKKI